MTAVKALGLLGIIRRLCVFSAHLPVSLLCCLPMLYFQVKNGLCLRLELWSFVSPCTLPFLEMLTSACLRHHMRRPSQRTDGACLRCYAALSKYECLLKSTVCSTYGMYGNSYIKSMDQPGKVAHSARCQLNRENKGKTNISLSAFALFGKR